MRFNTVEIGHAYSDYLDFLEDWPPPEADHEVPAANDMARSELDAHGEPRGATRAGTPHH